MKIIINESSFINLFEAVNLDDIHAKYYNYIPQQDFFKIVSSDPTWNQDKPQKMGKYGKWLLSLYKNKRLKLEDLYKAKEYLSYFNQYSNVIQNKDINTYKSLNDLYNVVSTYMDNPNQASSKKDAIRKIKEGAQKVYEDNNWLIIVPHTQEASCYYGKGTQWCTAASKTNNMFDYYNEQGPLYININKSTNEKYQFHFESNSFMDETDTPINEPICNTINLSQGALNWYKSNVNDWKQLCEEVITLMASDDDNDLILKKFMDDKYWKLVERDEPNDYIATDLIIDDDTDISKCEHTLYHEYYATFKNAYGLITLICSDDYNHNNYTYLVSAHYKSVKPIDNVYESYGTALEIIDEANYYQIILLPEATTIYSNKNSNEVIKANYLYSDIIGIYKQNGLVDLVNFEGESLDDVRLIDDELKFNDDYTYGIVLDSDGNEIKFNIENLAVEE